MRRRVISTVITSLGLVGVAAGPASAHAIIELNGVTALAGKSSLMTLEVQHGCLPNESTTQVDAYVGPAWRGVSPAAVTGWTTSVAPRKGGGWHITWVDQGEPIPFVKPTFFPITVDWPKKPGTYGMRVTQQCTNNTSYDWNDPYRPATANYPSPPLTPRPVVKVQTKAQKPKPAPSAPAHIDTHAH